MPNDARNANRISIIIYVPFKRMIGIQKGLIETIAWEADVLPLNYSRNRLNYAVRPRRHEIWRGARGWGKTEWRSGLQRQDRAGRCMKKLLVGLKSPLQMLESMHSMHRQKWDKESVMKVTDWRRMRRNP